MAAERPDFGSERFERSDLKSERHDLGSERSDLGSERPDFGSEGPVLGGDVRKPEKIALCGIIGHRPLRGRCPKMNTNTRRSACRAAGYR